MKKIKPRYCRECGEKLEIFKKEANSIRILTMDGNGGCFRNLASCFDGETGKRIYATVYKCPKYARKIFGTSHDVFCILDKNNSEIIWGISI